MVSMRRWLDNMWSDDTSSSSIAGTREYQGRWVIDIDADEDLEIAWRKTHETGPYASTPEYTKGRTYPTPWLTRIRKTSRHWYDTPYGEASEKSLATSFERDVEYAEPLSTLTVPFHVQPCKEFSQLQETSREAFERRCMFRHDCESHRAQPCKAHAVIKEFFQFQETSREACEMRWMFRHDCDSHRAANFAKFKMNHK